MECEFEVGGRKCINTAVYKVWSEEGEEFLICEGDIEEVRDLFGVVKEERL